MAGADDSDTAPGVHTIRLRAPWERLVTYSPVDPTGKPDVAYRRRFNLPTGLGPNVEVWLVVEQAAPAGNVSVENPPLVVLLNGLPLPAPAAESGSSVDLPLHHEFLLSGRLQPRNELLLRAGDSSLPEKQTPHAAHGELPQGTASAVRLEIRPAQQSNL